ncbi:MAG: phosphatidate cytidylyltransferase [archaeon]|jgi:dolichol kinase
MSHTREYVRKAIHVLFGLFFILLIQFAGTQMSALIIGLCLIAGTILSFAIIRGHEFPFIRKMVENVERENEKHFPGKAAVYFFVSAILLLILFKDSPQIILAALSVQVFADSAAALIGITFGKHKLYKKKTWEGSIACLIVSIICINLFFPLHIAIIGGIVATLIEILPLDDNLWVPLFTATAIRLLL